MMNFLAKFSNTNIGLIVNNIMYCCDNKYDIVKYDLIEKVEIWKLSLEDEDESGKFYPYSVEFKDENNVYVSNNRGMALLSIDNESGNLLKDFPVDYKFSLNDRQYQTKLNPGTLVKFYNRSKKTLGIYNIKKYAVLWEVDRDDLPTRVIKIICGTYYMAKDKRIVALSMDDGRKLWDTNLEEIEIVTHTFEEPDIKWRIQDILGEYDQKLFLSIYNRGYVVLNAKSGKFIKVIKELPYGKTWNRLKGPKYNFLIGTIYSKVIGTKIVCLAAYYYWELDMKTLDLHYYDLKDYILSLGLFPVGDSALYKERFIITMSDAYSTGYVDPKMKADSKDRFSIVVFDTDNRKVIYQHSLAEFDEHYFQTRIKIESDWLVAYGKNYENSYMFKISNF